MSWLTWLIPARTDHQITPFVDTQTGNMAPPGNDTPTDEDILWARQQTMEIIRRARELDVGVELEELGR